MNQKYTHQLNIAISFGLTSGVISSLGIIVGLHHLQKLVIVTAIIIMAISDGLADAAGIHLSEEAEMEQEKNKHTDKEGWLTTLLTLFFLVGVVITFVIPILIFPLGTAVFIAIGYGMLLLILLNYYIAKIKKVNPIKLILEHILLAIVLIIISNWIGNLITLWFK
jgi:VIT1/CCC1 family predicted Fe2+/Mn2+ transporter